jgi:hypothetical protein
MRFQLVLTLLSFVFLAGSIALFLGLFYDISRRLQRLRTRVGESDARRQAESTETINGIASLRLRIDELETDPAPGGPISLSGHGMNSTMRAKVLKMHRLGQPSERIAGTLQLPKGEVELLVKVHQVVMKPYQADNELRQVG